jgi:hypothetical protein
MYLYVPLLHGSESLLRDEACWLAPAAQRSSVT